MHKQPQQSQLSGFLATTFPKIAFAISALGILGCFLGFSKNPHYFFFSYLNVFMIFLTLSLGGLFFVLIQFLVRGGWSVGFRRIAEHLMKNVGLMAILFVPILFGIHHLYHWSHPAEVAHDVLLQAKHGYLNVPFFLIRAVAFFGIWIGLAHVFYKKSTQQDVTGDPENTVKLQKYSTFGILLFAISLTFAGIDWVMSITPHWYSTMIGVYFFAGAAVVSLATMSLIALILRRQGYLKDVLTVEHFHDLGKLVYGFNVFWSYIAFSQYFLIWYSNIPEETAFYMEHFAGTWQYVAAFLAIGHFAVPFVLFMSRHAKRNYGFHALMMCWFIFIHIVDHYWFVMPNVLPAGFHISWINVACFAAIGGLYLGVLFKRMATVAIYPIQDPRVNESAHMQNL